MNKTLQTPAWFQYPSFNWKDKHAVIIGGGIAGAQMAWHLCQSGWRVTLIERHAKLATEASGNPAGVISPKMTALPSDGEDFYTQSFDYTLSLLEILEQAGKKIDWDACGALQLAHTPREVKRWEALKKRQLSTRFIQLLDEDETQKVAGIPLHSSTHSIPSISPISPQDAYKSSYFPKGAWINPASFVTALCDHPQCEIIHHTQAISLEKSESDWRVIDGKGNSIAKAEVIIIANGKDLFSFEQSGFLPNMPVAGQTTSAEASEFSGNLKTVVGHEGYLTPAINSQHTFGATFDRNNSQPRLNPEANTENLDQLSQYLPAFAKSLKNVKSAHVAVRMTTPDRFPYVGALPDKDYYLETYHDLHQGKQWKEYPAAKYQEGLFILGGLGSRGLTTSGYCAKFLTDLINNKMKNKLESNQGITLLKNCHPARFLIKNLKRNMMEEVNGD